jgi:hypothetical protein
MGSASWSVQRRLSEIFEAADGPLSTLELAARFYQVEAREVTDAQLSAVRRALNALARKGALVGHREDGIARWATRAGWNAERAARWRG